MDKKNYRYNAIISVAAIISMLAVIFALTALAPQRRSVLTGKLRVAATVFPLYDIVRNVAGESVSVQLILPPTGEPHTFEPTPSAMNALQDTAVVYAIGHGLDSWLEKIAGRIPQVVVDKNIIIRTAAAQPSDIAAAAGIEQTPGDDPHYWLSIPNARLIAANVAEDLSARFPTFKDEFARNQRIYDGQLADADAQIRARLVTVKNRNIISLHDAWYYFSDAYGLRVAGTFEPTAGREPTPRYLAALKRAVDEFGVRTLYHEPQFDSRTIETFAQDNGLRLTLLDDLGGTPNRDTYIKLMNYDAFAIAENQ